MHERYSLAKSSVLVLRRCGSRAGNASVVFGSPYALASFCVSGLLLLFWVVSGWFLGG